MSTFKVGLPTAMEHIVRGLDAQLRDRIRDRLMEVAKEVVKEEAIKICDDVKSYVHHHTDWAKGEVQIMIQFNGEVLK